MDLTMLTRQPQWTALVLTLAVLLAVPAPPGGSAFDGGAGHWDDLGEDGMIWVPAERPAASYLPDEDLGDYHNYTETVDLLMDLAATRPDLFTLMQVGTSVQGRAIWMVTVSAPGDASARDRVLFDAAHHGNEVIGSEILTRLLMEIQADYDTNSEIQAILDATVLDVVPIVNVDGHSNTAYCNHYADCRKNANGVDLNRNYPANWGGAGSSSSPSSATYHGPFPLSEPEAQAVATLLDGTDYALHATMHSGTELVLWPLGYTTERPAELDLYQTLGAELSALSGAAHGQASRILYVASGTTMDQAYVEAEHWHAVSFTPEVYGGPGGAFDWWYYFNPAEQESTFLPVVAPWLDSLWHLAEEAPLYAPALVEVPQHLAIGPDAGVVDVDVTAFAKRPLMGASVRFDAQDAPVRVLSQNPLPLVDGAGTQSVSFTLLPDRGGVFDASFVLDAGPAGSRVVPVTLDLDQVVFDLGLDADEMGAPDANAAHLVLGAGPFDEVNGQLRVALEPSDTELWNASFAVSPGSPHPIEVDFDALALNAGPHEVVATATFSALRDGEWQPGMAIVSAPFFVHAPELDLMKWFISPSPVGDPVTVVSVYRNTGTVPAVDVTVTERVPPGYTYWFRDGPIPIPFDPLGSPPPDEIQVNADGSTNVTWNLGDVDPGMQTGVRYRVIPLVPGEHALVSAWSYVGEFATRNVLYEGREAHPHEAI